MFFDEARIYLKAGDGGNGCNSLHKDKFCRRGRPDGGPGGKGGDIIIETDPNTQTLLDFQYRRHFRAERGGHGSSNHKTGFGGKDLHIKVPPGTTIRHAQTKEVLRDLVWPGDRALIAKGGEGGRGNSRGRMATEGDRGEELDVLLELKLVADVGIIGYPNAGKSTLISKISNAKPKIASYPFTTREPILGVVRIHEDKSFVVADIPGLIEGAHKGRGLGDRFLRHIERTKLLIHMVDIAATEGRDPCKDYVKLNGELKSYSPTLARRPQVIALNKIDSPEAEERIKAFKKKFKRRRVYAISALTGVGIKALLRGVFKKLQSHEKTQEDIS